MIANIVDSRNNRYNISCDAAYEPSCNDNVIAGATQFAAYDGQIVYEELCNTTVESAIKHADKWDYPVTMYLYDAGCLASTT